MAGPPWPAERVAAAHRRLIVPLLDRRAVPPQPGSSGAAATRLWKAVEMIDDEVAVVIERELALLTSELRGSADRLEELLDPDFEEIGKSGRLWTRGEMIASLVADTNPEQHSVSSSEMRGRTVGPGLVLLTYVTEVEGRQARRSSLWRRSTRGWRVLHHQGTPIP